MLNTRDQAIAFLTTFEAAVKTLEDLIDKITDDPDRDPLEVVKEVYAFRCSQRDASVAELQSLGLLEQF